MIQVILFIFILTSNMAWAEQTCVMDSEKNCCQVKLPGIGGTAYAWRWVGENSDQLSVNLVSVSADASRLGAPNQWLFDVCVSQRQSKPMILKFQYESHDDIAKQEEVKVVCE